MSNYTRNLIKKFHLKDEIFFIFKMEEAQKKAQEAYLEYQALDQHIKQLQKQLEALTSQLMEMSATSMSLEEFEKIKIGREVFIPLSSGIFAKASVKDNSELLVNVGANVVVKKDVISTKKLINKQIEEMKKLHGRMLEDLEKMANRAAHIEAQLQNLVSQ